jgi:hypothetical protein
MTSELCLAILAHNKPECLSDLLENLRALCPEADVVLFNGGRQPLLPDGLSADDVCPYSEPLSWARNYFFQISTMRWLYQRGRRAEFLVTLDSDMLLIKPGLLEFLQRTMSGSAYMAVSFEEIPERTPWIVGRRFHYLWRPVWQPIFGIRLPFGCFNPGQVFRWEYVERLMRFPRYAELLARMRRSSVPQLEEVIYPTLAVTLGCAPRAYPGSGPLTHPGPAIRDLRRHSPDEIRAYLHDPNVYLIHPVHMALDAPDRSFVRALWQDGQDVDESRLQAAFEAYAPPVPLRRELRRALSPLTSRLRNAYLQLVPE